MRLPFSMRSDYLVWDPPRYQDENDRPEKPYIAPAPTPPEPAALFFNGVRNCRTTFSQSKAQSSAADQKVQDDPEGPDMAVPELRRCCMQCGGLYLEIDTMFASHTSPWDRFSPYFDLLAEYFADAFKQDNGADKLTADTSLLLAMGQPVNTMKAVTFQPTKTVPKIANLSGKMDVETDPVAIQAALQRWSDSLASESKKMQHLLEDLRARDASVKEWEAEVASLKKTWQDRLKSLEEQDVSVQVPVQTVKVVKVSPSLLDDVGEAGSSTFKVEVPVGHSATPHRSANDSQQIKTEVKTPKPTKPQVKTPCDANNKSSTHRQPTVEDGPAVDCDAPDECSSETDTSSQKTTTPKTTTPKTSKTSKTSTLHPCLRPSAQSSRMLYGTRQSKQGHGQNPRGPGWTMYQ
ncbi:hypothetical protein M409DRAFT_49654 [Zasmidium cellare ATCC 36951]|uniref:Uncharacterized protein n=1 Tax=Zasmidium cellare ATCC 36951 TaxID=1080233 RepID=A0A6A6D4N8_ZASCE|nr:uncharacterized protein M409DRAFT_49654 [Zasmidium cellare ATCC 36951]KAF2173172.1 hypothetical protein M409DRAFT_49654 [Zasmidium cellare ATCC 36951]